MKLILNKSIISSELTKGFVSIPMDIEGEIELNLITLISFKRGIKKLDANVVSSNLLLPPQMVSGFNIPSIKASPLQIDTKMSPQMEISKYPPLKLAGKEMNFI